MLVGVVSDTHGHVDPRLIASFANVGAVLHAGDVGSSAVLEAVSALAPVYAVQGNNDARLGGLGLPMRLNVSLAGVDFHLVHELRDARPAASTQVIVGGHSHRVLNDRREGVIYLNPGAAGLTGFHRVLTAMLVHIEDGVIEVEMIELGPRPAPAKRRPSPTRIV